MKKILFATTALVATAGVASADVALSGWAEMGIYGGDSVNEGFFQDIDVTFTMSGTTDNGLTFGASVDLDENGAFTPEDDGGATIFISGDFGTVTMGDTDGALDWAMTEAWVGNAGSLADDETSHAGAMGAYGDGAYDGQILRYNYSVGDFGVAVSVEMDDTGLRDAGYAIGFRYGMDLGGADLSLGLGYQTFQQVGIANPRRPIIAGIEHRTVNALPDVLALDVDIIGVSAAVTTSYGLSAAIQYSVWDISGPMDRVRVDGSGIAATSHEVTHVGVGIGYEFDAFTVSANWGQFDSDVIGEQSGYGLAAAYDLGGGLGLHVGYGFSDPFGVQDDIQTWSFGAAMSF